eukprot:11550735-Ditylum_brightwellii.AAC.2
MVHYNANLLTYDLAVPFYNTGFVEECLKFWQNLQAVITGQNVINAQGMHMFKKSMTRGDALAAFENAEGNDRPQTEPNYK